MTTVKDVLAEMSKRRLEQQLTQARQAFDAQVRDFALKMMVFMLQMMDFMLKIDTFCTKTAQMAELEELKDLKRQWQVGAQEFAPDGTQLGQDVPDFEDTADHGPHASPAAPVQPQPLNAGPPPVRRPSSAHPKLGGGYAILCAQFILKMMGFVIQMMDFILKVHGFVLNMSRGGGSGDEYGSGGSLEDMLLTDYET